MTYIDQLYPVLFSSGQCDDPRKVTTLEFSYLEDCKVPDLRRLYGKSDINSQRSFVCDSKSVMSTCRILTCLVVSYINGGRVYEIVNSKY